MTPKQLESRVRRIVQDAGKRRIWRKAHELSLKFSKDFGKEKIEVRSDHTNTDRWLRIFTGSKWVIIKMWNCHWGPMNIAISVDTVDVFNARSASKSDLEAANSKGEAWRFVKDGKYQYAEILSYKPGQWEGVLELHEAKRLLLAEREAKVSVEEKAKKQAEEQRPLTDAEKEIAKNFGVQI